MQMIKYYNKNRDKEKKHIKKKLPIFLLVIVIVIIAAFYSGLVVRKYVLIDENSKSENEVSIVLLSDLHNTFYGDNQERLAARIKRQKPDLILISGDMIDSLSRTSGAEVLLSEISDIAPIYFVLGNHEFWTHNHEHIISLLEAKGAIPLRNEYVSLNINGISITLCGVDDPDAIYYSSEKMYNGIESYADMLSVFDQINEDTYNILIAHRPELIEDYKKYNFDLVVSGHAHGGQVRIPFLLNGLYAPNQGYFPKYAGGRYDYDGLTHIVSRGLSIYPSLPRIFNPPEVVVVNIMAK